MKSLIMGTAGHIDHGKTALVKLLTAIDCDTAPEEKKRGITINLGFAHLDYSGLSIGIIDVPGHKDFISTMISGAFGIDFVMLVISAESGVMPQTREHLKIMQLLGIKKGFVALTKIDLVDSQLLLLAIAETKELIKGTFLEDSPIALVSSLTGDGLDNLKEIIYKTALQSEEKSSEGFFRMFIDRIFTIAGFGTVVTGTSLGGRLRSEIPLYLIPGEKKLRIRRIEKHGLTAENVPAGSRVSINLAGLEKQEFKKGMVVSEKPISPTRIVDAKLNLISKVKLTGAWFNAIFLSGTFDSQSRIHCIDMEKLFASGENVAVQIHLSEPSPLMRGDKFIIRNTSNDITLGGGEIIDAYPLNHKRRPAELIEEMRKLSEGGIYEFIMHELGKNRLLLSLTYFSELLSLSEKTILEILDRHLMPGRIMLAEHEDTYYAVNKEKVLYFEKIILHVLENYHRKNPLDDCGRAKEELLPLLKEYKKNDIAVFLEITLGEMINKSLIRRELDTFVLKDHRALIKDSVRKEIDFIEDYYRNFQMRVPVHSEVLDELSSCGIDEEKFKQIMNLLISKKKVCSISGNYIHSDIVESCKIKLLTYLCDSGKPVTVAEFRDITNGNRKMCLLLLNYFDEQGLTQRDGDYRIITDKGRQYLYEQQK